MPSCVHEVDFFEIFRQDVERRIQKLQGVDEPQVVDREAQVALHIRRNVVHLLPGTSDFPITVQHEVAVVTSQVVKNHRNEKPAK